MAEYEELAASAGYDSDDSDGADTDEEVRNPFIILLRGGGGWGWELDLTLKGVGEAMPLLWITMMIVSF